VYTRVDVQKITSESENCNAGIAWSATGPKPGIASPLFGVKKQGTARGRGIEVFHAVEIVNPVAKSPYDVQGREEP